MTRNLGFKAVALLYFATAGCAGALVFNAPGVTTDAPQGAVPPGAPACEVTSRPSVSTRAEQAAAIPAEDSSYDDLAPDPFAGARHEFEPCAAGPDDLAPDPFSRPRHETRLRASRALADDDLAPNPFARRKHGARQTAGKPLAADGLAPAPF